MRLEVNARGLTQEEIQGAIDRAYEFKQSGSIQEWQEKRKGIIKEIGLLLVEDCEFAADILQRIKEHHPELLKQG